MKKKLFLVSTWMVGMVGCLFFSMILLIKMDRHQEKYELIRPTVQGWTTKADDLVFSAIPPVENRISTSVGMADARSEILRQYLAKYNSPLEPYSELLVRVADENGFDFRWMVAIAQQESNLCKRIPPDSYNCWGWGIYGDKVTRFASFDDAIVRIAPQFKEKFLSHGPDTQAQKIMETYTPPSDGSWAFGVDQFMGEME